MDWKQSYGPWALLVGGSEGIGEHLAHKLGDAGINRVLVTRKPEALAATAEAVRADPASRFAPWRSTSAARTCWNAYAR